MGAWSDRDQHVRRFIDEQCEQDAASRLLSSEIALAYNAWAIQEWGKGDRNICVISKIEFGKVLTRLGLTRVKTGGRIFYLGIKPATCQDVAIIATRQ